MLAIVRPADLKTVLGVAERWDVSASIIGTVVPGGDLRIHHRGELVAEIPAASLSEDAPLYRRPLERPDALDAVWAAEPA
ncbi:MAG: phosphoribosylformylglycinamidine synthase subunit PurL, partial [Actinobacteria bacterium]|nr:phosphoribosylformylglycinamidine synthase subunit PurL [Actinomycetota bacterium]